MINFNNVIDGNYFLYRAVFILHKLKTLYGDLETLLLNDFNNITNEFPFDKIYFISDSKRSWRKDVYAEYKGKRKKDEDIDWEFVFDTFDKFKENIKGRYNCHLYQIDPFEGDDIIAHIIAESNKNGISNLIISNDSDLHQLLKYSTTDNYINIIYNHKFQDEKIFMPENYKIFFKHIEDSTDGDIFNLNNDIDFLNYFDKITTRAKIVSVNREESYFKKIVAGDIGDNILSVAKLTKETKGIGIKGSDTVYSMFKQKYPNDINFDSDDFVDNLTDILSIYKKNNEFDFTCKVIENIKTSRQLTRLDGKYLPFGYQQILYDNIKI
jgi:5'-3' exonuclease